MTPATRSAVVRVPASTSNLGAGFDCVGVALDRWLTVSASLGDDVRPAGPRITHRGAEGSPAAPGEEDLLLGGFRAACAARAHALPSSLTIDAESEIPVGRGLGSSAAAYVAGAALANELLGLDLDRYEIAVVAAALEHHPDNVAPSVFGGAVLAIAAPENAASLVVSPLDLDPSLRFVLAIPDFPVSTARARAALPPAVSHATAVQGAARAAALVRGLATGDGALLALALDDVLHVPFRRQLVRGYDAVTGAARSSGAFGATLSGSGSTIIALATARSAPGVARAMRQAWRAEGVASETHCDSGRSGGFEVRGGAARTPLPFFHRSTHAHHDLTPDSPRAPGR